MTNKFFFQTREQNITAVGGSTAGRAGDVLSVCDAGQVVTAQPPALAPALTQSVSQ